jgi:hypothetical protein
MLITVAPPSAARTTAFASVTRLPALSVARRSFWFCGWNSK